jgi:WD40 repeat protein
MSPRFQELLFLTCLTLVAAAPPKGKPLADRDAKPLPAGAIVCLGSSRPYQSAEGGDASITCLVFSADGKTVAAGSRGQTVHLWDACTGRPLRRFAEHRALVDGVALSRSGHILASSSQDKMVCLWDARTGRKLHTLKTAGSQVGSLSFYPDDRTLQVCDLAGIVWWYDVASGKLRRRFSYRTHGFGATFLGPDGLPLVSSCLENVTTVERFLFRLVPVPPSRTIVAERYSHFRISHDGRMVVTFDEPVGAAMGRGYRLRVWEVATVGLIADLGEVPQPSCSLIFSADGWGLFTGHGGRWPPRGKSIRAWELLTGKEVHHFLDRPWNAILSLALTADGGRLASGSADSTILIWDISSLFQPAKQLPLSGAELKQLWSHLGDRDARRAYRSMYRLAGSPDESVPFLLKELQALVPPSTARLQMLIAHLDDEAFTVRESALSELKRLGRMVELPLRETLKKPLSLVVHLRIERLLRQFTGVEGDRPRLQILRGTSVLERIRTAKARAALSELAKVSPGSFLGRHAHAALQRLAGRPIRP